MSGLIFRSFALFAAFLFVSGMSVAQGLPAQTSNQSAVTVKVTPQNLNAATWAFDVVFDTHAQDLNDNLLKSAVLIAADDAEVLPVAWQGDPPGGHHRKGVLRFNALTPAPAVLELRITRAGEPKPRSFRWALK